MAQPEKKTSHGHFDRFRVLVDFGWVAALSKNELAMWMAYERHADRDGIAFPDGRTLARLVGHATDNHVADLRRSLVSKGLLEVVQVGGGRGNPTKVRVIVPNAEPASETLPNNGSVYVDVNPPESDDKPSRKPSRLEGGNQEINPPEIGHKPSQIRRAYKDELPKNCLIHSAATPRRGDPGEDPKPEPSDKPKGKPTTLQARAMAEVWEPKWSAAHYGASYSPARVDFVKLAEILSRLRGRDGDEARTIDRFGKIADTALAQPEEYGWQGHKLTVVEKNLPWLISETAKREGGGRGRNGMHRANDPPQTVRF